MQAAQGRAEQIVAQARVDGEKVRREADEYVLETLTRLEMEMERTLTQVRNGIRAVQSEKQVIPQTEEQQAVEEA